MAQGEHDFGSAAPEAADLQAWVEAHGERLLRSAYLLCGDAAEAQDLVQETFLQAFKSARHFRGESSRYTWLHGILLNLSRRQFRRQKRLVFEEQRVLQEAVEPNHAAEMDQKFEADELTFALQQLSPEHREVVVLRYYENLKVEEIAQKTGVSTGTVKSRLHYAVRCLERLLPAEMNVFCADGTHH